MSIINQQPNISITGPLSYFVVDKAVRFIEGVGHFEVARALSNGFQIKFGMTVRGVWGDIRAFLGDFVGVWNEPF